MSGYQPFCSHSQTADSNELVEPDDFGDVLAALQRLAEKTHHPVVRACLEEARDDIVHLTSKGEPSPLPDKLTSPSRIRVLQR